MVKAISAAKREPKWMLDIRLAAFEIFLAKKMPTWGGDLSKIDFDNITYYLKPSENTGRDWKDVPDRIKKTFERLGIPEAEQKFLGGVGAQYESESVYHSLRDDLSKQGVIFCDMDTALREHPEVVKKFFGTIVPSGDNKFAALNTAVWSGGSFVYVPKGVAVKLPLQAYFRINAKNMGQFERTLIIADEGASVHYIEGCFVKRTLIKTLGGLKPIESINVGDHVLTHTGEFRPVYDLQRRKHNGILCTLRYFGDSRQTIKITGGHPVFAVRRTNKDAKNSTWNPQWIEAGQLNKGDYIAIPIDRTVISHKDRFFPIEMGSKSHPLPTIQYRFEMNGSFFRLAGYYLAEGSVINDHHLTFTFNKNERDYIDDTKSLLEEHFGKEPIEGKEYNGGVTLTLCSTLRLDSSQKSLEKAQPTSHYLHGSWQRILKNRQSSSKAIGAAMETTSSKSIRGGTKRMFRINTISEKLAEQTRDILLRLDIFASINVWNNIPPRKTGYAVYVGGSFIQEFSHIVGSESSGEVATPVETGGTQTLLQKTAVSYAHITEKHAFVPIRQIIKEAVSGLDVYNFSVLENESYVAGGIVVHNCTAPVYSSDSLHAAVVEVIAHKDAKIRYTTIQNWSGDVYNLVTKRAMAREGATVEWIDGNLGSKLTMKYPSVILAGKGARADILSVAYAGEGQHQDAGAKVIHLAPETTSRIISKSVSKDGGRSSYRGMVRIAKGAIGAASSVRCDALILDDRSRSDTYPTVKAEEEQSTIAHEAYVGRIGEDQLFYLMSRGLPEAEALALIVLGFINEFTKELPMEYSIEMNKLIRLEMEGSVG